MKKFYQKIDTRSRKAMVGFLTNHFRYHTMNSWNRSTSYACNIKIHKLELDSDVANKLYDIIEAPEFYEEIRVLLDEFAAEHDYRWQIGTNGRSGGYMVLYQGERKPSGYKSYCRVCGQQNYKSAAETGNICGRCHRPERVDYPYTHMNTYAFPGQSVDMREDFEDWSMDMLRERVQLVQEFDRTADAVVELAVYMATNYAVEDEIYYEPKSRKVLVPNSSGT